MYKSSMQYICHYDFFFCSCLCSDEWVKKHFLHCGDSKLRYRLATLIITLFFVNVLAISLSHIFICWSCQRWMYCVLQQGCQPIFLLPIPPMHQILYSFSKKCHYKLFKIKQDKQFLLHCCQLRYQISRHIHLPDFPACYIRYTQYPSHVQPHQSGIGKKIGIKNST